MTATDLIFKNKYKEVNVYLLNTSIDLASYLWHMVKGKAQLKLNFKVSVSC